MVRDKVDGERRILRGKERRMVEVLNTTNEINAHMSEEVSSTGTSKQKLVAETQDSGKIVLCPYTNLSIESPIERKKAATKFSI